MFEYFYHETLRRTIVTFGTLFNNIQIKKTDNSGNVVEVVNVPLAYGPTQKFLSRLRESPDDLNNPVQITLPRMSFEFNGLFYDVSRKLQTTQTFISKTSEGELRKAYMPVPYTMQFEMSIMTKLNDDMLQIIEQIVPYFQPSHTLTVDLLDTIGEKRDIPITLEGITMEDDYEGDFSTRRALIYTLKFNAKTYLFGPMATGIEKDIIKKVSIGYLAGGANSTNRDVTYSVEPKATTSLANQTVAVLETDIQISDAVFEVSDAANIPVKSYISIDNETLFVTNKTGNKLNVTRGSYGTKITNHLLGSQIYKITASDDALVSYGDDFGFNSSF
jgi:hypothetical protein